MAGTAPIVTRGFLFEPSFIVTAGYLSGEVPPVITDTIINHGGDVPAARNIDVLQLQLGQRENSGTQRVHASGRRGRSLGVGRRLGQ